MHFSRGRKLWLPPHPWGSANIRWLLEQREPVLLRVDVDRKREVDPSHHSFLEAVQIPTC